MGEPSLLTKKSLNNSVRDSLRRCLKRNGSNSHSWNAFDATNAVSNAK
ncbi:hypothetical protein EVA_02343 [gut metagenome]|uniref:Uncharacterized protein n=1 Tax=gut metagenome TaxID=749906 RepID=J9H685_9ZZZZ